MSTQKSDVTLETVLTELDTTLADEIRRAIWIQNPIDFARLVTAREIPRDAAAFLLRFKVEQKPPFQAPDLSPLFERAVAQLWSDLTLRAGETGR